MWVITAFEKQKVRSFQQKFFSVDKVVLSLKRGVGGGGRWERAGNQTWIHAIIYFNFGLFEKILRGGKKGTFPLVWRRDETADIQIDKWASN